MFGQMQRVAPTLMGRTMSRQQRRVTTTRSNTRESSRIASDNGASRHAGSSSEDRRVVPLTMIEANKPYPIAPTSIPPPPSSTYSFPQTLPPPPLPPAISFKLEKMTPDENLARAQQPPQTQTLTTATTTTPVTSTIIKKRSIFDFDDDDDDEKPVTKLAAPMVQPSPPPPPPPRILERMETSGLPRAVNLVRQGPKELRLAAHMSPAPPLHTTIIPQTDEKQYYYGLASAKPEPAAPPTPAPPTLVLAPTTTTIAPPPPPPPPPAPALDLLTSALEPEPYPLFAQQASPPETHVNKFWSLDRDRVPLEVFSSRRLPLGCLHKFHIVTDWCLYEKRATTTPPQQQNGKPTNATVTTTCDILNMHIQQEDLCDALATPNLLRSTSTSTSKSVHVVGQRSITLLIHTRTVDPTDRDNVLLVSILDASGNSLGSSRSFAMDAQEAGLLHLQLPCGELLVRLHSRLASDQLYLDISLLPPPITSSSSDAAALAATVSLKHHQVIVCQFASTRIRES